MDSTDGDNLNLSCGENDIGDELKIAADETYDTRSEVSSSSTDSDSPSISTVSSKSSSRGDNKRSRRHRGKRSRSRDSKSSSSSPETKRARSKEAKPASKTYDYATKLNYLFRDARWTY